MPSTVTNRHRIRHSFGHIQAPLLVPHLLKIQLDSYERFLQREVPPDQRKDEGLEAVFRSVFPISDFSETSTIEYISYSFDEPKFDTDECIQRGLTYAAPLKVTLRLIVFDVDEETQAKSVKDVKEQDVYMSDLPLMTENGTFIINGTERVVVSQMHRSPGVFFDHDKGKTHSSGKILFAARIIPYRGSWMDFEFDPKDNLYARIDRRRKLPATILLRALGFSAEEILDMFFDTDSFEVTEEAYTLELIAARLRGETAQFDICDKKGVAIVEEGSRITARHIREMEKAGLTRLSCPPGYVCGHVLARDLVDSETGEVVVACNTEITEEILDKISDLGITSFNTIYTNDLDCGSFISDTIKVDSTSNRLEALVEIYRMMRPGEPPTKEAAENLFTNLFFSSERYDLSSVGRMKFNRRLKIDSLAAIPL